MRVFRLKGGQREFSGHVVDVFYCFFPHQCTQVDDSLQYYELILYHTVPLGSNLSLLQSLSASFTTCLTGMRGAAGGCQPAATNPPWYQICYENDTMKLFKITTLFCYIHVLVETRQTKKGKTKLHGFL